MVPAVTSEFDEELRMAAMIGRGDQMLITAARRGDLAKVGRCSQRALMRRR